MSEHTGLYLRGGRLIDPAQQWDAPGDVLIIDDSVRASGNPRDVAAAYAMAKNRSIRVIDIPATHIIAPGLIDLHVHLREPGYEIRENIHSGAMAAARGGYTTICAMPNTSPVLDNRGILEWVKAEAATAAVRVLPIAAITKNEEGAALTEMAELAAAGAVAFSDDGKPVRSSSMMSLAMQYALTIDRPIVNHCEDPELVGKGVMNAGPIATRLGLRGWPATGEIIMLARDLELARMTGGRYHAAHLSTARSVDLVRQAKLDGLRVTAEVTPHHLLLSDAWVAGEREGILVGDVSHEQSHQRYDTATKVNPPLRTLTDGEALLAGLLDGTIDVIATDHAPHSAVDKCCSYDEAAFGISGLETALAALLTMTRQRDVSLSTLLAAMTIRPAQIFNLAERIGKTVGTLIAGASGDIVVFDPDKKWLVDTAQFASLGTNTPLQGMTLHGRVCMTISAGRIVYEGE